MRNKYTQRQLALGAVFFLISSLAVAQEKTAVLHAGSGAIMIGAGNMDVSPLHNFVPNAVDQFGNQQFMVGGTGHAFLGNFVIGGTGYAVGGDRLTTTSNIYSLGGGVGTFDMGYLVVNTAKTKIFPMVGIGGAGYGMR